MAKNDHITVWMNGKKTKITRGEANLQSEKVLSEDEHAAAMDKQPYYYEDTLWLPEKNEEEKAHYFSASKTSHHKWKPVIITIFSAVFIGTLFGMIMLKIVGSLDGNGNNPTPANGAVNQTEDNANGADKNENNGSSYTIPEWKAFVIQGGVYETEDSVDEYKPSFQDADFAPAVWERDDQYFLLIDIAPTKEESEKQADDIKETYDLDVFAKEWQTKESEVRLGEDEQDWMDDVIELWESDFEKMDDDGDFSVGEWQDLIDDFPKDSGNHLEALANEMTEQIDDLDDPSRKDAAGFLLHIWHTMETDIDHEA